MKLQGKTAIITGGSRGIGKTIAGFFVREGANVLIAARSKDELASAQTELAQVGVQAKSSGRVEIYTADVSKKEEAKAIVKATIHAFQDVHILVNAAGVYGAIGAIADVDFETWKRAFEANIFGTMNVIQEVLPIFMKKNEGKIINFSGGGDGAFPYFSAYSASKIAVVRFTEALAEEVKAYGIMANAIAPGAVNTKFLDEALSAGEPRVGKVFYEKLQKQKEEGGVSPEKAAELCVFLATGESGILSGKMISAVWDDWKSWDAAKIKELMESPKLTMRRTPYR
jgi:NAD(P)-dependent dehydrogenase (short-subunit alcohol dehydrogenase family)